MDLPLVLGPKVSMMFRCIRPHCVGRIERLGNGYESRLMLLEPLNQLVKIQQAKREKPVDLIHNDDVDPTSFKRPPERRLRGRAVKRPAGHAHRHHIGRQPGPQPFPLAGLVM